jgi:hypothetical protein
LVFSRGPFLIWLLQYPDINISKFVVKKTIISLFPRVPIYDHVEGGRGLTSDVLFAPPPAPGAPTILEWSPRHRSCRRIVPCQGVG